VRRVFGLGTLPHRLFALPSTSPSRAVPSSFHHLDLTRWDSLCRQRLRNRLSSPVSSPFLTVPRWKPSAFHSCAIAVALYGELRHDVWGGLGTFFPLSFPTLLEAHRIGGARISSMAHPMSPYQSKTTL